jgi:hypothetical protein
MGYDPRALKLQNAVLAVAILATYALTGPEANINWVFSPQEQDWDWMPQPAWVALYLVLIPLLVYWPLHAFLSRSFRRDSGAPESEVSRVRIQRGECA